MLNGVSCTTSGRMLLSAYSVDIRPGASLILSQRLVLEEAGHAALNPSLSIESVLAKLCVMPPGLSVPCSSLMRSLGKVTPGLSAAMAVSFHHVTVPNQMSPSSLPSITCHQAHVLVSVADFLVEMETRGGLTSCAEMLRL
jgi:hypothetical protein